MSKPGVGDKGQRFEISVFDTAKDERIAVAWCDSSSYATNLANGFDLRPGWRHAQVLDRQSEPEQEGQELTKGCVVMMKASSGMKGYGNRQCISEVCEPLGTISLYGHNQHYKTYDIDKVLEYPALNAQAKPNGELVNMINAWENDYVAAASVCDLATVASYILGECRSALNATIPPNGTKGITISSDESALKAVSEAKLFMKRRLMTSELNNESSVIINNLLSVFQHTVEQ